MSLILKAHELRAGMLLQLNDHLITIETVELRPRSKPTEVRVRALAGRQEIPFDAEDEVEVEARNGSAVIKQSHPIFYH